jgi:aspartyl protease family protein
MKLRLAVAALLLAGALEAAAATVFVMSVNPAEVSLVINGSTMRTLRPGETSPEGVRVLLIRGDMALIEVDGRRWEMRMGSRTTTQVVLQADSQGHFYTTVLINGQPVRAVVDTGASTVALNMAEARRVNVNFAGAQRGMTQTANGIRATWRVSLATVQLGDIVLRNIEGGVAEGGSEQLSVVLLGMSFLNHLDMQRSGNQLILIQKH